MIFHFSKHKKRMISAALCGSLMLSVGAPVFAFDENTITSSVFAEEQIESNLIYPHVVGSSIGLPGMWVLVAVTVGGDLMGVGGMLLMIPVTSVIYALLREFTDKRLAERGIPAEKLQNQPPELSTHYSRTQQRRERQRLQKMKQKFLQMQNQMKK